MAKRKTARRATRARTPGAARAAKAGRKSASRGRAKRAGSARRTRATKAGITAKKAARSTKKKSAKQATATPRSTARASVPETHAVGSQKTLLRRRPPSRPRTDAKSPSSTGPRSGGRADVSGLSTTRVSLAERNRRLVEQVVPTPPSSLNLDNRPSAARSGRAELEEALQEHTAERPVVTAGDLDADWESAYNTGDEAPGGDMPTPDQAVVEEIGTAIGLEYNDNEELKSVDKIEERDRHRWELDPASSEDYQDRARTRPK
jgi:uncharacterized protein DUF6335